MKKNVIKNSARGFTLIELLVVIGLFSLGVWTAAEAFGNSERKALDATNQIISLNLKNARNSSSTGVGNIDHHVTIYSDGISIDGSSQKILFPSSISVTVSPSNDILFKRPSGIPVSPAMITITHTSSGKTKTITVNSLGVVSSPN